MLEVLYLLLNFCWKEETYLSEVLGWLFDIMSIEVLVFQPGQESQTM